MFDDSLEGLRDSEAVVIMAIFYYNNQKMEKISESGEKQT